MRAVCLTAGGHDDQYRDMQPGQLAAAGEDDPGPAEVLPRGDDGAMRQFHPGELATVEWFLRDVAAATHWPGDQAARV